MLGYGAWSLVIFDQFRYMNGAATNPDVHVLAYAGAQVKKCLEVAQKLGAENFIFWGGREGYQSLLNTDLKSELSHMANFFKMAVSKKTKLKVILLKFYFVIFCFHLQLTRTKSDSKDSFA